MADVYDRESEGESVWSFGPDEGGYTLRLKGQWAVDFVDRDDDEDPPVTIVHMIRK